MADSPAVKAIKQVSAEVGALTLQVTALAAEIAQIHRLLSDTQVAVLHLQDALTKR
jgi:hypothetical protein